MQTKYYINNVECSVEEFYFKVANTPKLYYSIEDVSNENGFNHRYFYN